MNKCLHVVSHSGAFSYTEGAKLYSEGALNEMGSFSSKVRSIRYGINLRESQSNEEINNGIEDEPRSTTNSTDMADNSSTQGQANTTNGDVSNTGTATSHEQQAAPKVGQSFSWLASSPVVLNTTTKEQKAKGKRPMEGRKTSPVMKYSNEKYLKSWQQHCGESSSSNAKGNAQSSSSRHVYEASNEERSTKQGNLGDASSSRCPSVPVGFGVVGKQIANPNSSSRSRLTVRTSLRHTLSLESKDEEMSLQSP